ncbi:uncharacterized protein LOC144463770 [Epinephelus lanceolatus]
MIMEEMTGHGERSQQRFRQEPSVTVRFWTWSPFHLQSLLSTLLQLMWEAFHLAQSPVTRNQQRVRQEPRLTVHSWAQSPFLWNSLRSLLSTLLQLLWEVFHLAQSPVTRKVWTKRRQNRHRQNGRHQDSTGSGPLKRKMSRQWIVLQTTWSRMAQWISWVMNQNGIPPA